MDRSPEHGRIVLPRLGQPAFVGPGREDFRVTLALGPGESDAAFRQGFHLTRIGKPLDLIPLKVLAFEDSPRDETIAATVERGWRIVRVQLRAACDAPLLSEPVRFGRFALFDLHHSAVGSAPHSIVVASHDFSGLQVLFAADLHVAHVWNRIESDIGSIEPDRAPLTDDELLSPRRLFTREAFQEAFVNPNRNLASLIRAANALAHRGELDLVIFGGDLVDYVYGHYRGDGPDTNERSNFRLFERMLRGLEKGCDELEVPVLTITGNHDYRQHPYRIDAYGLRHCGLHDLQTRLLTRAKRAPRLGFPTRRDVESVFVRRGSRSLTHYLNFINPSVDYGVRLGELSIVCLDTGRDAWLNAFSIHPARWLNLIRSAREGLSDPASEGLYAPQIAFLGRWLRDAREADANILLIIHAGLLNPAEQGASEKPIELTPYLTSPHREDMALERHLFRRSLNVGCIFQGQAPLLDAAASQRIVGLSGHIHRRLAYRLEPGTGTLHPSDRPEPQDGSVFYSAAALGHLQASYDEPNRPGFYLLKSKRGRVSNAEWHELDEPPLDGLRFWLREIRTHGSATWLEAEIDTRPRQPIAADSVLILTLLVVAAGRSAPRIDLEGVQPLAARGQALEHDTAMRYVARRSVWMHSSVLPIRDRFRFSVKSGQRGNARGELTGVVELARPRGNGWVVDCCRWHPVSFRL